MLKESLTGICLLGASFAELDASWLQQAAIFIAAVGAGVFYWKGALKKDEKRVETRLEKIERDMRDTATKSELRQIEAQFKSFESEIRRTLEENDNKSEHRALKTHGRINEVLAAVSRLQGKLEK